MDDDQTPEEKRAAVAAALAPVMAPPQAWRPPRPDTWYGATGAHVVEIQKLLEGHGVYSIEQGDEPGYFGPRTEDAVRAFQTVNDLSVDAIVGSVTWLHLDPKHVG